jgi:hypothetical protein
MKRVPASRRSTQRSPPALRSISKRGATPARGAAAKKGGPRASTPFQSFPTKPELQRLAALAEIKSQNQTHFYGNIKGLIEEARYFHKLYCGGSKTYRGVLRHLRRITTHSHTLTAELLRVVEAGQSANPDPEKTFIYDFLNGAIERPMGARLLDHRLAEHVQHLTDFAAVSVRAEREARDILQKKGRPAGAGGNYAFNMFVRQLYLNAKIDGGKFTNARASDELWSGSFIEAVEILRPYLPSFFPHADLGRAIQHIVGKLRAHLKTNRSKYRRSKSKTKNRRLNP